MSSHSQRTDAILDHPEPAADGLDALDRIEQGGIDLAVLDFEMPRLDGLGVLEELRAQMRSAGSRSLC